MAHQFCKFLAVQRHSEAGPRLPWARAEEAPGSGLSPALREARLAAPLAHVSAWGRQAFPLPLITRVTAMRDEEDLLPESIENEFYAAVDRARAEWPAAETDLGVVASRTG